MVRLGVVSTSRADFGLYLPVLEALRDSRRIEFGVLASGMHLANEFGMTIGEIRRSGIPVWQEVPCLLSTDTAQGVALSIGQAVSGFAHAYAQLSLDMLLLLGDRFEMFAAAAAAAAFRIPMGHIHGGEETEGAYDNAFRHAISKLSHLHFAATPLARRRLLQMGERADRVVLAGAPGLELLVARPVLGRADFLRAFGLADAPYLLVTFHPETMRGEETLADFETFANAMLASGYPLLVTLANADNSGRRINAMWSDLAARHKRIRLAPNLGPDLYGSAMRHAAAMVGNSSSGIIEAASMRCPVVNVGSRQSGRERSGNVIDAEVDEKAILGALSVATSQEFRDALGSVANVYGDGTAGARIARVLEALDDPRKLLIKRFELTDDGPV
jgi:UDP-hydrolysing UDP-N-acetyl-D-glucosamine 2-epimerase